MNAFFKGLGKYHPVEQALDEVRAALTGAGQIEPAQSVDTLITMRGKSQLDKCAQAFADSRHLLRKVECQPALLDTALRVQALNQLPPPRRCSSVSNAWRTWVTSVPALPVISC